MKIIALEESTGFATLDTEKLFSRLKSHELSHKGRHNHDASLTCKALITSARVGGHDANPTNTVSSALEFALSSLAVAFDDQYESILDDEIALQARKFRALQKFRKERRRSPKSYFECSDTTHFIADCPKRKKFDSSNKYDYTNWNDYSNKATTRRRTALETRRRRSSKRSCLEPVLAQATLTSQVKIPLPQKRMRRSSASKATSPVCALWANLQGTSLTSILM
jgi:hypothetical protein